MFRITPLTYLMMLAVLAAHAHCMATHGWSAQQQLSAPGGEPSPAGDESSCENESACICKGAVLSFVQLDLPSDDFACFLAIGATLASDLDVAVATAAPPANPMPPPPLDGDVMRAQLQVLRL
jgi:hypothetical protein